MEECVGDKKEYACRVREELKRMLLEGYIKPKCRIVTIGGAGKNIGNYLAEQGLENTEIIHLNTDATCRENAKASTIFQMGKEVAPHGTGTWGFSEVGETCMAGCIDDVLKTMENTDIAILIAGLGGGTGGGAAPLLAEALRKKVEIIIGICVTPFEAEDRRDVEKSIKRLDKVLDVLIVLENERLLEIAPHATVKEAFDVMNSLIAKLVKSLTVTFSDKIIEGIIDDMTGMIVEMDAGIFSTPTPPTPPNLAEGVAQPPVTPVTAQELSHRPTNEGMPSLS